MRFVFLTLCLTMSVYIFWLAYVSLLSRLKPQRQLTNMETKTIAVVICAKNEEKVIGALLESLNQQDYDKVCYKTFVVAHNCTDHTAETAKNNGAEVIICNNDSQLKTSALKYGLDFIDQQYNHYYRYYAVFDADALVPKEFLKEINKGLMDDVDCVNGYYGSKNFSDSLISRLSGLLYHSLMHLTCMAHDRADLPVNIYGSGYVARMELKEELPQITTLVGDFEFSGLLVLHHHKMIMAPKAVFYAEMPTDLDEALKQRRRWAVGDKQCFNKYHHQLLKELPALKTAGFKQLMDLWMIPVSVITFTTMALGLLYYGKSFARVILFAGLLFYFFFLIVTANTMMKEKISFKGNLMACLLEPFWILLTPLMSIDALFYKNMIWQPSKRSSFIRIEEVERP